jgi:hypothetical protein
MMGILGSRNTKDLISNILVFLLYILVLTFILRYLWNGTLVKHISILRPVNTLLETFLLAIGLALFKM